MVGFIRSNFLFSVFISVLVGGYVTFDRSVIFYDMYTEFNPLINNLVFIPIILSLIQLLLWFGRYRKNGYKEALLMGLFFCFVVAGFKFYTTLNHIEIKYTVLYVFGYIGLSHISYFAVRPKARRLRA